MSAKYRLADRLLRERRVTFKGDNPSLNLHRELAELADVPRVEISDISAALRNDDRTVGETARGSGPLRPPFPKLWMEWEDTTGIPSFSRVGALIYDLEVDHLPGKFHNISSEVETRMRGRAKSLLGFRVIAESAERNTWTPGSGYMLLGDLGFSEKELSGLLVDADYNNPKDLSQYALLHCARPIVFALGLMNCKNVQLQDAPDRRSKKAKRRGAKTGLSFKTIKLPDAAYSGGGKGGEGGPLRLHTVRGHFKTYSDEAPLLGKHTGTYWWAAQARGSKRYGEIVKDYEVSAE